MRIFRLTFWGKAMADLQAFRGLRYDTSKVGSLTAVLAPPYDVINGELQNALYDRSEYNVVRLILNRGDDLKEGETIYDQAAQYFHAWRRSGVLKPENEGSLYVYHQNFTYQGQNYNRRGFMARVRLEKFGEGKIYPHEETHSKAKEDRFRLNMACRANLSQIFGIFPDEHNQVQSLLESAIVDQPPLQAVDDQGAEHKLWVVSDPQLIARVSELMGPKSIYIADGHHRYETALNIQAALRQQEQLTLPLGGHPVDYVLMNLVSMHDPGMAILPTHRLFRGVEALGSEDLIQKFGAFLDCQVLGKGAKLAGEVWETIELEDKQSTMGFYCRKDDTWVIARLTKAGEQLMEQLAVEFSEDWRSLGVSVLHRMLLPRLLGYESLPSPKYVHSLLEVVEGISFGDVSGRDATGQEGSGSHFELVCLVMPASVEHVKSISEHGERMPAKSTYFYPKLLSGLVINPFE
jgi:uncharacterized protein (DUF1015 family)